MQGREVRRFRNEYLNAGRYSIGWDCKDNHGASLSNGNYIIKMSFGRDQMSDKITLLR
jgi:flagellar hook assembly protein FlgD